MTKNLDPGGGQEVEGQGHPHLQAGFETQELSTRSVRNRQPLWALV